jgi:hypothetical protein
MSFVTNPHSQNTSIEIWFVINRVRLLLNWWFGSVYQVIDIAPMMAEAIRRIHNGESISVLFNMWLWFRLPINQHLHSSMAQFFFFSYFFCLVLLYLLIICWLGVTVQRNVEQLPCCWKCDKSWHLSFWTSSSWQRCHSFKQFIWLLYSHYLDL